METDRALIDMFPNTPYKLLMRWNDARAQLARAGEAFVAAGRVRGSVEDMALIEAEHLEAALYRQLFGI